MYATAMLSVNNTAFHRVSPLALKFLPSPLLNISGAWEWGINTGTPINGHPINTGQTLTVAYSRHFEQY